MRFPFAEQRAFCGLRLTIGSTTGELQEALLRVFGPPEPGPPPAAGPELACGFHLAPEPDMDAWLPVDPTAASSPETGLLLADGVHDLTSHKGPGRRWWRHCRGLGRQFWDLDAGRYQAVLTPEAFDGHFPLRYLYSVLALSSLARDHGVVSAHAACAVVDGRGLLLSGVSGGGKSTTSLVLAGQGHPLLSDERVFLRAGPRDGYLAESPSDLVKISPAARERFAHGLDPALAEAEYAGDLYFKLSRLGLAFQGRTPVSALCSLEKTGLAETTWQAMPPARAVAGLFPVTMPLTREDDTRAVFRFLTDFLRVTPCFRVSLGTDPAGLGRALRDLAAAL